MTTDYVVLTAGLVGIGVAVVSSLTVGVRDLSTDIDYQLRGVMISDSFAQLAYFDDFENGAARWVGGVTDTQDSAYGGILGRYGGTGGAEVVTRTYSLRDGYDYAVVEFDLHAIDSWDNESMIIFANGEPVSSTRFAWQSNGVTGQWVSENPNYQISVTPTGSRSQTGYNTTWADQSFRVRMEVASPGEEFSIGFGSTLNQSIADESWAIDNVGVTSTNTPGSV